MEFFEEHKKQIMLAVTAILFVAILVTYGKKTNAEDFNVQYRGGKGVKTLTITDKNGTLVAMKAVNGDEDLIIVTNKGVIIRTPIQQISQTGRATQGVKLIRLTDEQLVSSVAIVEHEESDESKLVSEEVQKVAEGAELDNKPESE